MADPKEQFNARSLSVLGQYLFIGVAALATYSFVRVAQEGESRRVCSAPCAMHADYLGADRMAPSFTLKDMNGQAVSLESFRGKTVVLNLWSRTCRPCLEEMPELAELNDTLKSRKGVAFLTITSDNGPEDVTPVLRQVFHDDHVPFPILFDPEGDVVRGKFGTHLFPETWIIDPNGIIRARFDGTREWTTGVVTQFVDEVTKGDYCPISIDKTRDSSAGLAACSAIFGS